MNNEELDNIITLTGENGEDESFEFLDLIELDGDEYVVLLPCDDEEGMVVILKVEDSGDEENENYVSVEDEATLYKVFDTFKNKFKDEFDFED